MKRFRMQLIDDWCHAWRFYSVHAMLVAALIGALIAVLPTTHLRVPDWAMGAAVVLAAVSGIVGRLVKQDPADTQRIEELEKR